MHIYNFLRTNTNNLVKSSINIKGNFIFYAIYILKDYNILLAKLFSVIPIGWNSKGQISL